MSQFVVISGEVMPVIIPGVSQDVTVSGTSAAITNAFQTETQVIMISCSTDCRFLIGSGTPTALPTSHRLPADTTLVLGLKADDERIAFIQESAGGTASVTEAA